MLLELDLIEALGQKVRWLVIRVDLVQSNASVQHVGREVEVFAIDVFGSWTHLWDLGDCHCRIVVFEHSALELSTRIGMDLETFLIHLFEDAHDWDCATQ